MPQAFELTAKSRCQAFVVPQERGCPRLADLALKRRSFSSIRPFRRHQAFCAATKAAANSGRDCSQAWAMVSTTAE